MESTDHSGASGSYSSLRKRKRISAIDVSVADITLPKVSQKKLAINRLVNPGCSGTVHLAIEDDKSAEDGISAIESPRTVETVVSTVSLENQVDGNETNGDPFAEYKLPETVDETIREVLNWKHADLIQGKQNRISSHYQTLRTSVKNVGRFTPETYKKSFLPQLFYELSLKVSKILLSLKTEESREFAVTMRYLRDEEIYINCTSIARSSENANFNNGDLVIATVFVPENEKSVVLSSHLGFIIRREFRPINRNCFSEQGLLKKEGGEERAYLFEDVMIRVPLVESICETDQFTLTLQPLLQLQPSIEQALAIVSVSENAVFKGLLQKTFAMPPSGCGISSDPTFFSSSQLDAIQKAVDLAVNPCSRDLAKFMVITGNDDNLRDCIFEIFYQLMKSEQLSNCQFAIICRKDDKKQRCHEQLYKYLKSKKMERIKLFRYGHREEKAVDFRVSAYVEHELGEINSKLLEAATDRHKHYLTRKNVLTTIMDFLKPDGTKTISSEIVSEVNQFRERVKRSFLKTSNIILATYDDLVCDSDFRRNAHSKQVDHSKKKLSDWVICDAPLNSPQVHALASVYPFRKFVFANDPNQLDLLALQKEDAALDLGLDKPFSHWVEQTVHDLAENAHTSLFYV